MKGLIVIGYQGIGKSTIAGRYKSIDLESSNFFVGDKRADDWYIPYCQTALSLANQGYVVLTSSHKAVVDCFKATAPLPKNVGAVIVICPTRTLKDEWIKKLEDRYEKTHTARDYKALMNAKDRYNENIVELCSCGLPVIQINAMDYRLSGYITLAKSKWCATERDVPCCLDYADNPTV